MKTPIEIHNLGNLPVAPLDEFYDLQEDFKVTPSVLRFITRFPEQPIRLIRNGVTLSEEQTKAIMYANA